MVSFSNFYSVSVGKLQKLPLFINRVSAGFPSPAEDHIDKSLDLNELLITNPPATFYLRVAGDSMQDAGIFERDILVVDRSITATHGDIVVAQINAEFTLKRFYCRSGQIKLVPENQKYKEIVVTENDQFQVFGVVTSIVRQLRCSR